MRTMQGGCKGITMVGDRAGGEEAGGAGTMCRGGHHGWEPCVGVRRLGIHFTNNDINSAGRAAASG